VVFFLLMRYRVTMNRTLKRLGLSVAGFALLTEPLLAVVSETPASREQVFQEYQAIVDRNPFGLKPPPPPPAPAQPEAPPAPKLEIFLTGIVSIVPPKRVFLKATDTTAKDPNKKDSFYSLQEGQAKDGIEILEIDARKREVRIRNAGEEKTLNFALNGIKAPEVKLPPPGLPGAPGVPGAPGMHPGQAGVIPPPINSVYNPQPAQAAASMPAPASTPTYTPTYGRSIPSRSLRVPDPGSPNNLPIANTPGGAPQANAGPGLNPEEQYLLLKANEALGQRNFQKGLGAEPPPIPNLHLQ
jgi:hypothetical protein